MTDERAVQQVLAKYVRGADTRDGAAVAAQFAPTGRVEIFYSNTGKLEPIGELIGQEAIASAVSNMMQPHPPRGWSHHTTHDPIIEVSGDEAKIDAQLVVFDVVGKERPADGWPEGASGTQGTLTPVQSGYYRPTLRRLDGVWKIETLRIVLDLPIAYPRPRD
jgi:hypothetical protein